MPDLRIGSSRKKSVYLFFTSLYVPTSMSVWRSYLWRLCWERL